MSVEKKNIFLHDTNTSIPYVSRSTPVEKNYPKRENSKAHATFIERKLNECYERSATQKQVAAIRYKEGVYLEFSSAAKHDLAIKSLENRTQGIRLLNVKSDEETGTIRATVYIPAGKESYFVKKIEAYSSEVTENGIPKHNDLVRSIDDIRVAMLDSFWIGKPEDIPNEIAQWCEVWIRYDNLFLENALTNISECCRTLEDFKKRVNIKMRGDDIKDSGDGSSRDWYLGVGNRDVGSIHSDFCEDLAVNLCDANYVAVYPVIGWWRERGHLGKYNEKVRYALVLSIETPEVEVDLYTPIITKIETTQIVEIKIPK